MLRASRWFSSGRDCSSTSKSLQILGQNVQAYIRISASARRRCKCALSLRLLAEVSECRFYASCPHWFSGLELLLSTADRGKTWDSRKLGPETVQAFSFANGVDGIALLSGHRGSVGIGMLDEVQGVPFLDSHVLLTHDGGQHWEDAALNRNEELRLYTEGHSVAALDTTHYLLGVRHPQVAVGYAVTTDGGKTWRLVQVDNVYATRVFVHDGQYWALGIEYLNRERGGGYGAPVSLHSNDGITWTHGVRGPNEFPSCNSQGCYLWDGVVESLYGTHERFWILPQDGTMTKTWAIAGDQACTVGHNLLCGPAVVSEQPPQRP